MSQITVAVNGVLGKMGSTVLNAVEQQDDMLPVGGSNGIAGGNRTVKTMGGVELPLTPGLDALLDKVRPDVVVDFTNAEGGKAAMLTCIENGISCVSGSTGITPDELQAIGEKKAASAGVGIISASNFALGCVVLIHLARIASEILRLRRSHRKPSRDEDRCPLRHRALNRQRHA